MNGKLVVGMFALALALSVVLSPVALAQDAEYVGPGKCKTCHNSKDTGAQFSVWSDAAHAHAMETLKSDAAKKIAADKGIDNPAEAPECVKCHTTAYDLDSESVPGALELEDSVSCEECHGPASLHMKDGMAVKFKKDESIDIAANIDSDVGEEKCVECHNPESPTWDPERFTTEAGEKVGFDFEQAWENIAHPNPTKEDA